MKTTSLRNRIIKRIGTTRIAVLSFVVVIVLGGYILSLPFCNNGSSGSLLKHLFVATSATCVTGLVPFAVVDQYTFYGHIVILLLIQVGGLGVMTLFGFILTILKERLYHSEKRLFHDTLNTSNLKDIPQFIRRILKYTFTFEMCGALILCIEFIPRFGVKQGIFNSIFLAVSAFCNAGIDNFAQTSLSQYVTNPLINIVIACLIVMGGTGFSVWFDIANGLWHRMPKEKFHYRYWIKHLRVHTRIVVLTTLTLIVSGAIFFYVIEFNNPLTLGQFSPFGKIMPSIFTSITLRTAGFSTLDMASFHPVSQLLMCVYMVIGGSPGGTAGGIKTTTLVVMLLTVFAMMKDEDGDVNIMHKRINFGLFAKSFMILFYYGFFIFLATLILLYTDPQLSLIEIIFECCSAIGTVGLSLNVTPYLSDAGSVVIMLLMLFGRVGPISIVISMMRKSKIKKGDVHYPNADILIG